MTSTRKVLFGSTIVFYAVIIVAVLTTSWLVRLDWQVMFFRPYEQWPQPHAFLDYYVVLGQRGPTAVMVAAWLGWRSWRQHTLRPLLALGVALLLLNVTVGAVKLGLGRLGPHYATEIGSAELFMGGDIFPSGHTANAVVTWGILAYLASTPRARRYLSVLSAVVALGVGATTVYLGTHWVSDVLLGWAAGLLIILALPWFEPLITLGEAWIFEQREQWRARRFSALPAAGTAAPAPGTATADPVPGCAPVPQHVPAVEEPALVAPATQTARPSRAAAQSLPRETLVTVRPAGSGSRVAAAHHAPRPHTVRSDRAPVTPSISWRPPCADRVAGRGPSATSAPRPAPGG
jgi:membrane-associated phospholipid phosphatase